MAGEAEAAGIRFFLDRGLGSRVVPGALRSAGWNLETMDERYGATVSQRLRDTVWVEEATLHGDVILCKDLQIGHNPLEAQVVYMTAARVFGLSRAGLIGQEMVRWFLAKEAEIVRIARRAEGPYVMAVHVSAPLRRVNLAYPP